MRSYWRSSRMRVKARMAIRSHRMRSAINVSESTLYPVLRRLQKDECLEVYDRQYDGRNRRYYKVTEKGMAQLNLYQVEWEELFQKDPGNF